MREIKFRAVVKETSEVFPVLTIWDNSVCLDLTTSDKPWNSHVYSNEKIELIQFTGLHDKNGTEIYEKDILLHHEFGRYVVKYIKGCFIAVPESVIMNPNIIYKHSNYLLYIFAKHVEVVGNVYVLPDFPKD